MIEDLPERVRELKAASERGDADATQAYVQWLRRRVSGPDSVTFNETGVVPSEAAVANRKDVAAALLLAYEAGAEGIAELVASELEAVGRRGEGIAILRREADSGNRRLLRRLAEMLDLDGRASDAERLLIQAADRAPGLTDRRGLGRDLAAGLGRNGRIDEAIAVLEKLAEVVTRVQHE